MFKFKKQILCEIQKIAILDRDTHQPLNKFKHEFLNDDGSIEYGYSESDDYMEFIDPAHGATGWKDIKAHDFVWKVTEFQGKQNVRLICRVDAESILRALGAL